MSNLFIEFQVMTANWGEAMWRASWQGGIAILLAWVICRCFPKMPQPTQSWLWRLAVIKLMLGLFVAVHVAIPVPSTRDIERQAVSIAPVISQLTAPSTLLSSAPISTSPPARPASPAVPASRPLLPPISVASACWLLWLLGLIGGCDYVLRAFRRVAALVKESTVVEAGAHTDCLAQLAQLYGIRRVPCLRHTAAIDSPLLIGTLRPALLIPTSFLDADSEIVRMVYAHELAHVRHRDLLWRWLLTAGQIVFFFHPLVWLARREWHFWHEIACDAGALDATQSPSVALGQALLHVVKEQTRTNHEVAAVGIGEPFRLMKRRLLAMERFSPVTRARLATAVILVIFLGAVILCPAKLGARNDAAPNMYMPKPPSMPPPIDRANVGIVNGVVTTPDGHPVAGAHVTWTGLPDINQSEPKQLAEVTTDAAGKFSFSNTRQLWEQSSWSRFSTRIVVDQAGWGLTWTNVPENGNPITIKLSLATTLRVIFVDEQNRPVSGLRVLPDELSYPPAGIPPTFNWFRYPSSLKDRFAQVTNQHGESVFANLPQGADFNLSIVNERYAQLNIQSSFQVGKSTSWHLGYGLADSSAAVTKKYVLHPAATIAGRVAYLDTGRPAAGIRIAALNPDQTEYVEATTDQNGQYVIKQLRGSDYRVVTLLTNDQAASWTAVAHSDLSVAQGEHREGVDFTLIPGALITGKITDTDTGQPIAGVRVSVKSLAHPPVTEETVTERQDVVTDASGVYKIRVPAGEVLVRLFMYPPAPGYRFGGQSSAFTISDGEVKTVNFQLIHE